MTDQLHLFEPGTDEYAAGTKPHNSSGAEHPAFVATASSAEEVGLVVVEAARRGLRVVPQATGHGAGGQVGDDTIILDTSALDSLTIDDSARTASAGAGLTWATINAEAEQRGLLGLAGSSPSVAIAGFTFGGGIGWLSRPHGMAASALRRVQYVDGAGAVRIAAEDAPDQVDRDALWAFRGGGGVGVATRLDFDLVAVPDLHAGFLLWTIDALDSVVAAWAGALPQVGDDVATSISVLHLPPAPPFPEALRGHPVVHLAIAASGGEAGALPMLDAMRAAAAPVQDTWGPADAKKLAGIHLDPPDRTPAIGDARWLTADTPASAAGILHVAAPADSALALIEIRSVGNTAPARDGAETEVPGPFIVHAVGALLSPDARPAIEQAFVRVRAAAAGVDVGRSAGSWMEGATSVPDALPVKLRERVRAIADAVDPTGVIGRSRYLN